MRALLLSVALLGVAPAFAEPLSMTCTNARGDYLVVFDGALRLNPDTTDTRYAVLAVEDTAQRLVIAGMVGQGSGLGFAAEFRPEKKIDLYSDDRVQQTDTCR